MLKIGLGLVIGVVLILSYLVVSSYVSDPYSPESLVRVPYTTSVAEDGQITFQENFTPVLEKSWLAQALAYARTGIRIPVYSLILKEEPLSSNEAEIIAQLHAIRFNPQRPYVITGGHYSDLYMRNLGIFYNALLDPRLSENQTDWQNRQRIATQTVAYDLAFLEQNGAPVTTIAPTGPESFTGLNIYSPPSDALFGVLFTLKAMQDREFIVSLFPRESEAATPVPQTGLVARELLDRYQPALTKALNQYLEANLDPTTGLIRRDIHLSSARDGISRESSFYDNVIAWATVQLADDLGISHSSTPERETWKQNIMTTFWDEELGIFRNDLSTDDAIFSADSLIVTSSGFFDLEDSGDRDKLNRIVQYIQKEQLDQPFPLRYSRSNITNNMHLTVRLFAPNYMGEGIWSHWGMEYIKALALLGHDQPEHLEKARNFLEIYRQNIEKAGGYPELYNSDGSVFNSGLVGSVLHSGWVVNYEQAKMLTF